LAKIEQVDNLISNYDKKRESSRGDLKENTLLTKRKSLLEDISELKRSASQTDMSEEQSALDKINAKYEALIEKIIEYNKNVDIFNNKNPKDKIAKIGQVEIAELNASKEIEINAEKDKELTENFKKALDDRKEAYIQYENAKTEIGELAAKDLFLQQTGEFDSYLDFLKEQASKISEKINQGLATGGDFDRFKILTDQITAETQKRVKSNTESLKQILIDTKSFDAQRLLLTEQYEKKKKEIEDNYNGFDKKEILDRLKKKYDIEIAGVNKNANAQAEIYKKLNESITRITKEELENRIKDLKQILENDLTLPPGIKEDIKNRIGQLENVLSKMKKGGETVEIFEGISSNLSSLANSFAELGTAIRATNEDLGDTLETMGDILGVASNAADAAAKFASGDIGGGIQSAVKAIVGVFQIGAKARESERQAMEEMTEFQDQLLTGEQAINAEYRERQREQVKLNKLRLQGLEDERKILNEQRDATKEQYDFILKQLQQESFIVRKETEKFGGFLGIGRKTRSKDVLEQIGDKTFEELEKLFATGQMTEGAKKWFEMLQKVNDELIDIGDQQEENNRIMQETLTGTTADAITDSIIEGFKNGESTVKDFADNFEDLMREALFNSVKFKILEPAIAEFYRQFADFAASGDQIDKGERGKLKEFYDKAIQQALDQLSILEDITGISVDKSESANSLAGSIKRDLTEETGTVIAGQFNGLRITAIEQLKIATRSLNTLESINKFVAHLFTINRNIQDLTDSGIKIRG
jgi:hypothetical protein